MERFRMETFQRVCTVGFGLLLWLQVAAGPLSQELSYPELDGRRVLVYALPVALLVWVVLRRGPIAALLFFPMSFAAILVIAPRSLTGAPASAVSFVLAACTLVAYVISAAVWVRPTPSGYVDATSEPLRPRQDKWRPYRGTFVPRAVGLVAIFLVSAALIPLYPPMLEQVARSFATRTDPAAVENGLILCNLVMFFIWCVLAYALFFVPALEMQVQIRHLETQMQAQIARVRSGRRRVSLLLAVAVGLVLIGLFIGLRST